MIDAGAVALWGFVATVALIGIMHASQELGLTRISLPFIIGTIFTGDRDRAVLVGIFVNFLAGWAFATVYAFAFEQLGYAGWRAGAVAGLFHGIGILTVVMPVLPALHPRMASENRGPQPTRALQPPGFLALNYGRTTPLVTIIAHMVYGAVLGGLYRVL